MSKDKFDNISRNSFEYHKECNKYFMLDVDKYEEINKVRDVQGNLT
jgi:mRNA-degrading endonuclease HigB of HigAB toxin-antitoxin module